MIMLMINEIEKIEESSKGEVVDFLAHKHNEILIKVFKWSNDLLDSIGRLFKQRNYNDITTFGLKPEQCDWGYYDFDNERLYFNFVEMQTRRFYQNHAESWDSKIKECMLHLDVVMGNLVRCSTRLFCRLTSVVEYILLLLY